MDLEARSSQLEPRTRTLRHPIPDFHQTPIYTERNHVEVPLSM